MILRVLQFLLFGCQLVLTHIPRQAFDGSVARSSAYGRVNGPAMVSIMPDGQAMPFTLVNSGQEVWTNLWNATLHLTSGPHQLIVTDLIGVIKIAKLSS